MSHALYTILENLDAAKIFYSLGRYENDIILIHITVPGSRYEIYVESDGTISTSTFKGSEGSVEGISAVEKIINRYKD